MISFDRPWALLVLPFLAVYFWALTRRSYAGLAPASLRLALGARLAVATLLTVALAGAHLVKRSDKLTTMFVLDVSRSIRPDQRAQALDYIRKALASKGADDPAGVIVFGRTSYLEDAPVDTLQELGSIRASVAGDATDLAGALRLAGAAFPPDTGRKIVVLSDGNENMGDAEAEMEGLRVQGVRIDVAPTALEQGAGGVTSPEAMVDDVSLPAHVRVSAPFALRVVVSSTVAQKATLSVLRDGRTVVRQPVALKAGKNAFSFPEKVAQTGFHRYDAQLQPTVDGTPENNHAFGYVSVLGRPRVLYVADPDAPGTQGLKRAMAAQDIDVQVQSPGAVPASVAELASYDSVVLSDVPSEELGPPQMAALEEAVKDFGVGLGMIGGPNSFGAGRYNGTPIESALPVKMDVRKDRRLPTAAIVVVLDASGSMAATENGSEKVQLGARAAVQLMGALQPDDQVAVTAVTETTDVIVPLEPASKAASAKTAIESVHAGGGGIFCNQGLTDAYAILLASKAPIKHVILCADTSDSEQQNDCVAMAAEMLRRNHITTTVCGIGHAADQHTPFLRGVAHAGGGQIFIVNQAGDLPRLFQRDVQTIQQNWFVEKPTLPRYNASDTVIAGVPFNSEPPLLGFNLTTPKPGATIALSSPDHNDPIFAYWRYGLGRTFAFTSDDRPHWAIQWLPWVGYERFWAQALRWSLRSNTTADFQTTVENRDGKGHLVVDAFNQTGGFINRADLAARVVAPDATARPLTLSQTAPGRYEGDFDADQTGAYMINVRPAPTAPNNGGLGKGAPSQTVGFVVPYSPEYRTLGPNMPLLTRLTEGTGGRIQSDPTRIFRDAQTWVVGVFDLAPTLLLLTALLFLADIAIRRLAIRASQVRETTVRGAQAIGTRVAAVQTALAPPPAPVSATQMNSLLERKVAARSPATAEDDPAAAGRLLARRALRTGADPDDPFPHVATLRPKPGSPGAPKGADYSGRLLDAKHRAQQKDE